MPSKTVISPRNGWQKNWRYFIVLPLLLAAVATAAIATRAAVPAADVAGASASASASAGTTMITGQSSHNDVSPPLRDMPQLPMVSHPETEQNQNPHTAIQRKNEPDTSIQNFFGPLAMPTPILNFDGIPFPGFQCNCAPPDTNGEVGATQYVQIVNEGYQVFNKNTGASLLGPSAISSIWVGFGGLCENNGSGDPVVLYDQLANRWLISQFAGAGTITDECVAVSTTNDATGSYNRYGFHLGSNFFDYPKLGVWPDAYYMSMIVFNAAGTQYLGPQPFAFDRAAMLAGTPATFITTAGTLGNTIDPILPADLDGSILPASGTPATFVQFPGGGQYVTYHFHVDFITPANSTWTTFATPAAAGFTSLCPATRSCVPQSGTSDGLDGIGDRLMFRLAYRKFSDGHESVVGNYSVSAGGVAGVRWFELRGVTAGPVTVFQESTYQPDTTWRWMGSTAMDANGDMALGYSASSASIFPQIRYTGRLSTDPINQMPQGEVTLFAGTGSQTGTSNRWGDYSDMTVDPVDDCTFWYTQEYYATTSQFNWRTRIGNFKFPGCPGGGGTPTPTNTPVVSTATHTPEATSTACTLAFTDVLPGSTFYIYVRCLACRGIINGYSSGCETGNPCFRPQNNVTRGQLAKIVSNSAGWTESHSGQTYQDVAPASTFYIYVERLTSRGVINGYPCGGPDEPCGPGNKPYYRPNGSATRGQIAKIDVLAAVEALGWTLLDPATNTFEDVSVGSTFFRYVETAYAHGVLSGYPCGLPPAGVCVPPTNKPYFVPNNNSTRGQTSKIDANTFLPACDTP